MNELTPVKIGIEEIAIECEDIVVGTPRECSASFYNRKPLASELDAIVPIDENGWAIDWEELVEEKEIRVGNTDPIKDYSITVDSMMRATVDEYGIVTLNGFFDCEFMSWLGKKYDRVTCRERV